jgi:hypothetical protein
MSEQTDTIARALGAIARRLLIAGARAAAAAIAAELDQMAGEVTAGK